MDHDRLAQINFTTRCNSPEQLNGLIQESLHNPSTNSDERKNAKTKFLGRCDGQAAQRVLNALESFGIPIGESDSIG